MKQVIQSVRRGSVSVIDTPVPQLRANGILVRTVASLVSPGTERAGRRFSQMGLVAKARSRPDLVATVIQKARRDGIVEAATAAFNRLEQPQAMGYSSAGRVIAVGDEVTEFAVGDRVACAGTGYAGHVEIASVPRNLAVPIPDGLGRELSFAEASFAALGAVALHGVRLAVPGVGDRAVVIGLGMLGLLAGQLLRAHGCTVIGVEPDAERRALATRLGFDAVTDPSVADEAIRARTRGLGADLILLTAASRNNEPVELAAHVARDRARIVAVGDIALDLPRREFYHKELSVVVSRSYGPGRYDREFEERGETYPVGYVRWTERENMAACLELVASGRVQVEPLITMRAPVATAPDAYERLNDAGTLGIVFDYPDETTTRADERRSTRIDVRPAAAAPGKVGVSVIGAGGFVQQVLLPILRRAPGVELRGVVSEGGLSARATADRYAFQFCASAADAVWNDAGTQAVIIATRNSAHASMAQQALAAGKSVFIEKPLCIDRADLEPLAAAARAAGERGQRIMAGFNRRFAPAVVRARDFFPAGGPMSITYRINAGRWPASSWLADPAESGGRILSEVCHFVDTAAFLARSEVVEVHATGGLTADDDVIATLRFANGSTASIAYCVNGDRAYSKERIELFGGGRVAVIDDFRRASLTAGGRTRRFGGWFGRPEKGHREELDTFMRAVAGEGGGAAPFDEALRTTRATFAIRESIATRAPVRLDI